MAKVKLQTKQLQITNPVLIGIVGLVLAVSTFAFFRVMLINEDEIRLGPNQAKQNIASQSLNSRAVSLPILMYHHIGELPAQADSIRQDLTVSLETFELQVAWLKGQGFESISINDLLKYSRDQKTLSEKPIIFTFDDGYADAFQNAVPILKKYGFTGSFAVVTQFPGIKTEDNQYADWWQIKQAKNAGMEIINHTQDHFDGTDAKYDEKFILRNLTDARKDLEINLGQNLPILVYPFGHYNEKYLELAKKAGFEMGLTTKEGKQIFLNNLMEISRTRIHGQQSLDRFKELISQ